MQRSLIEWAEKHLGSLSSPSKEAHGNQSTVLRLRADSGEYVLKIAKGLRQEQERIEWLSTRLPVPRVVAATSIDGMDALLLSAIPGVNLKVLSKQWPAPKVVDKLAHAIRRFHLADTSDWPFGAPRPHEVLIHGDACMPNLIFDVDDLSGYVDLGGVSVGEPETDLAAAVWTLHHNLGPGHGLSFLQQYGFKGATATLVEELRLRYVAMLQKWQ